MWSKQNDQFLISLLIFQCIVCTCGRKDHMTEIDDKDILQHSSVALIRQTSMINSGSVHVFVCDWTIIILSRLVDIQNHEQCTIVKWCRVIDA